MAAPSQTARWTDEMDAELARLAGKGASINDVARALNVSRNAVSGRARRKDIVFQGDVGAGIRAAAARRASLHLTTSQASQAETTEAAQ